jgi:hypothetical protein
MQRRKQEKTLIQTQKQGQNQVPTMTSMAITKSGVEEAEII